jgi:transmembrane sensor
VRSSRSARRCDRGWNEGEPMSASRTVRAWARWCVDSFERSNHVTLMTDDIDWIALSNYLADRATPEQRLELEHWLREYPEHGRLLDQLSEVWAQSAEVRMPAAEVDVDAAWGTIARRMGADADRDDPGAAPLAARRVWRGWREHTAEPRRTRRIRTWWLRAAAAAVVLIGISALLRSLNRPAPPLALREFRTERGQRAELRLSDGSRVTLGVDSRLRWPSGIEDGARDVYLNGEALFDVAHDGRHPFRVHTMSGVVEDIGTRFVVRAYPGDARALVAVKEGAVAIASAHGSVARRSTLQAGDLGHMVASGRTVIEHGIDVDPYLAFASGRLVFQRTPMRDVATELERWYDVRVVVADSSLAGVLVSASFRNEGLRDVLVMLTTTLGAQAEWTGQTVTLSARP